MKKIFSLLLIGVVIIGLTTGCGVNKESGSKNDKEEINNNSTNLNNDDTNENIKNDENDVTEEQSNSNSENSTTDDYYVGTYYMALTDGSLAKDGTGTVILNKDKSCAYYYGWSDFGCKSFSVVDHLICLKTTESQEDICLTLVSTNDMLIDANNEKYIKE